MLEAPSFINMQYTYEDGMMTPNAFLYNEQTASLLQTIVGYFNKAVPFPQWTTTQINTVGGSGAFVGFRNDLSVPVGTIWFNSTTKKLNVKTLQYDGVVTPGIIEEITSVLIP